MCPTACHLLTYTLNRAPELASRRIFIVDKLHSFNHSECDTAHNLYTYETLYAEARSGKLRTFVDTVFGCGGDAAVISDYEDLFGNTQAAEQFHRCPAVDVSDFCRGPDLLCVPLPLQSHPKLIDGHCAATVSC